MTVLHNASLVL